MDKIYVVMMTETCWTWAEPRVTPIFASWWENICDTVVDRLKREMPKDMKWHIYRSFYVDEVPVDNEMIMADMFVKKFVEGYTR